VDASQPAPQTRPSNRKATIVAAAARLFHERGFTRVSVDDIAGTVGISAPAVYRHFRNKHELLQVAVIEALELLENVVSANSGERGLAHSLADLTTRSPHLGALLAREVEHLDAVSLKEANRRTAVVNELVAVDIHTSRPHVSLRQARVLADAVFALVTSNSFVPVAHIRETRSNILRSTIRAVYSSDAIVEAALSRAGDLTTNLFHQPWLSRSEAILAAGPRVIGINGGYEATTLDDLGAAAGISGSSVYNHFSSKSDLFHTVALRAVAWSITDLQRALATSRSGEDALARALASHIELTRSSSGIVLLFESLLLSPEQENEANRDISRFAGLWFQCIRAARPDIDVERSRVLIAALLGIASGLGQLERYVGEVPDVGSIVTLGLDIVRSV